MSDFTITFYKNEYKHIQSSINMEIAPFGIISRLKFSLSSNPYIIDGDHTRNFTFIQKSVAQENLWYIAVVFFLLINLMTWNVFK